MLEEAHDLLVAVLEADEQAFEKAMGITELHRVRVSREDAVDSGLIKRGVRCAAYFVDEGMSGRVDLEGTVLRDGVMARRGLKHRLAEMKVPLVPLLLVQVHSEEKSVEKAKAKLIARGVTEEQIAVHTADEPDSGLLALANDEKREVLIFKMAVALGFDAPRAFTLVSMRTSRDPEFGAQLVGRILRVHRLLQGRARAKKLPEELNYGYVFLAAPETQTGLDIAGQKINAIQTEYAKVSTATVALRYGEGVTGVSRVDARGQMEFFGLEGEETRGGNIVSGTDSEVAPQSLRGDAPGPQRMGARIRGTPRPRSATTRRLDPPCPPDSTRTRTFTAESSRFSVVSVTTCSRSWKRDARTGRFQTRKWPS